VTERRGRHAQMLRGFDQRHTANLHEYV
jgi:hypothetical protein